MWSMTGGGGARSEKWLWIGWLFYSDKKVCCAFLDASKAFDKVLHNGLFLKLIKRKVPVGFVRPLKYWYVVSAAW